MLKISGINRLFAFVLAVSAAAYPLILVVLILCTVAFPREITMWAPWKDPAIRHSAALSVISSTVSAVISVLLAVPCGYVLSRYRVRGSRLLDILLYLPIVLPQLVIGVSLLVFFRTATGRFIESHLMSFTFAVPGIIAAQTIVATAFAIRIVKMAFDAVPPRRVGMARTLGAGRWQAFRLIELREAIPGLVSAFALAWATALGTFGSIIIFCGTTRYRTEVLSTSIFLEFSVGNLDKALIISLWMGAIASAVLLVVRGFGKQPVW